MKSNNLGGCYCDFNQDNFDKLESLGYKSVDTFQSLLEQGYDRYLFTDQVFGHLSACTEKYDLNKKFDKINWDSSTQTFVKDIPDVEPIKSEIKIKQIGNGDAFDYEQCNSSFLIDTKENTYLLFDCGYSVYTELRKQDNTGEIDLKKLKYIYISHMDDDHIGSLKTLIYYMYFMLGTRVHVLAANDVFAELTVYLRDIDGFVENNTKIQDSLFNTIKINKLLKIDSLNIEPTGTHHFKSCYGLKFTKNDDPETQFIITGDTKASFIIKDYLYNKSVLFCFHDFSNWNNVGSQVHCCEEDFESVYSNTSENIKRKIIKYHTSESFNPYWRSIDKIKRGLK